ncbi:hypothetical protein Y032_0048g1620 [Ancylostoma ceylanicum]|uniref:Uncharacterized protein n=1 Tax=Ancylostoma ceylanicum TaxID=53326 RepID=A0A016UB10_9BILA|nr:hypothetical protein Y032_0048g1620 [Ancylostoma ceylanicum]
MSPNYGSIRFLHDHVRPLTLKVIRQKILDLGWEVLTSPPYRRDLVPIDYQPILTLSNALHGKAFDDEDDLNRLSSYFFESMPVQLYAEGIETLLGNFQRVTHSWSSCLLFRYILSNILVINTESSWEKLNIQVKPVRLQHSDRGLCCTA